MATTFSTKTFNGIPVTVPNKVTKTTPDFYVSFNNYDTAIYGCTTTAIVIEKTSAFLILNGDHTEQVKDMNLAKVCAYFHANADQKNKISDPDENYVLPIPDSWK